MLRAFLVKLFRRSILVLILICLGCSAQQAPTELSKRIERQVRTYYSIPAQVEVQISAPKASEFPNYDAIVISFVNAGKKQDYDFLVSKDGKTLVRMTKMDLTKDPHAELMKKIDVSGRPTRGNKDAKVVAVNFDDFQCPFCSRMHETLFNQVLKEYGDRVLFIYKDYPLTEIHRWATHAAVNANCLATLNNEAYWDFADYIHANQREINGEKTPEGQFAALDKLATQQGQKHNLDTTKLQACIKAQKDDAVQASVREGNLVGVDATPTMFVNGEKLDGAVPLNELRATLDRALKDAGVEPPQHPAENPAPSANPTAK
jgi:protein-disulfide isomerase